MNIKDFLEFNKVLPDGQARLLMGPAGIGKSAIVKQIADEKGFNFIDLRLSELEPSDLVGLPHIEADESGKKVTSYAEPWWWPQSGNTVLFLDEVDRCREDMQPIAMQLTLDRRAGGRNLPEGVIVFAACNGEKYMTSAIDQALMNRFAVVELAPSAEEWLSWAEKNNIHQAVVNYIRSDKKMLDTPEKMIGVPNQAVPTRRSWSNLGLTLNRLEEQMGGGDLSKHDSIHLFAAPFVGLAPAQSFAAWVREKYQVIQPSDIFSGSVQAENLNIVQVANVVQEVADMFIAKERTSEEHYNCLKFFMDAGHEAFAALFSALDREAAYIIEKYDDVDKYIKDNVNVLSKHLESESTDASEEA